MGHDAFTRERDNLVDSQQPSIFIAFRDVHSIHLPVTVDVWDISVEQ